MTSLSRQNQRSIARSWRTVHYNIDNGRHRGDWRFKHMICFHGFPGWVLPRISPQKERQTRSAAREAIAALSTNQKEPRRHIKIEYEKRHEDSSRDDKKTEDVAAKKRKKTRPRHKHKVQLGSLLTGESSLLIFVKWKKTRDALVDSQGCEKTTDESQSPEVRGDKIGDPVGWGKGKADTVVSSEPSKLTYER